MEASQVLLNQGLELKHFVQSFSFEQNRKSFILFHCSDQQEFRTPKKITGLYCSFFNLSNYVLNFFTFSSLNERRQSRQTSCLHAWWTGKCSLWCKMQQKFCGWRERERVEVMGILWRHALSEFGPQNYTYGAASMEERWMSFEQAS